MAATGAPRATRPTRHFETLDSMRGVAALAVVCMHAHSLLDPVFVARGYLAVDFFFALSGLVIAYAYEERLAKGMSVGRFMLLRIVRLYPLYLLGTLMGIGLVLSATLFGNKPMLPPANLGAALLSAFLMLPSPLPIEGQGWVMPFNIVGWSLVFELAANLLFAVARPWLRNGVLGVVILVSGMVLAVQTLGHGDIDVGAKWETFPLGVARTVFSFCVGVLLARMPRPAPRRSAIAWLPPMLLIPTFFPGPELFGPLYELACVLAVYPLLIFFGSVYEPMRGGPFRFLGLISFAIYAIHPALLSATELAMPRIFGAHPPTPWIGIVTVAGFVLAAWIADIWYDRPVRRWLGKRLHTPPSAAN